MANAQAGRVPKLFFGFVSLCLLLAVLAARCQADIFNDLRITEIMYEPLPMGMVLADQLDDQTPQRGMEQRDIEAPRHASTGPPHAMTERRRHHEITEAIRDFSFPIGQKAVPTRCDQLWQTAFLLGDDGQAGGRVHVAPVQAVGAYLDLCHGVVPVRVLADSVVIEKTMAVAEIDSLGDRVHTA